MQYKFEKLAIKKGIEFEDEICGQPEFLTGYNKQLTPEENNLIKKYKEKREQNKKYTIFDENPEPYFSIIKKIQKWDNPEELPDKLEVFKKIIKTTNSLLQKKLSVNEKIKYYSSINTPLDDAGIDAFIEFMGIRATIDITASPYGEEEKKGKKHKADIIIAKPDLSQSMHFKNEEERMRAEREEFISKGINKLYTFILKKYKEIPTKEQRLRGPSRTAVLQRARERMKKRMKNQNQG